MSAAVEAVAWVTDADVRDFGCGDGESIFLFAKSGKWSRPLYSKATVDTLRAQLEAAEKRRRSGRPVISISTDETAENCAACAVIVTR